MLPVPQEMAEELKGATEQELAQMRVLCMMAGQNAAIMLIDDEAARRGLITDQQRKQARAELRIEESGPSGGPPIPDQCDL